MLIGLGTASLININTMGNVADTYVNLTIPVVNRTWTIQRNYSSAKCGSGSGKSGCCRKRICSVADEVRNLASKSAEAAKGTTALKLDWKYSCRQ